MYESILLLSWLMLLASCASPDPDIERILTEEYPPLQQAIEQRDGAALLEFTAHPDSAVKAHAWQALIQTEVSDWNLHLQKVLQANTKEAWSSLWLKDMDEKKVQYFNLLWQNEPRYKHGLATVFAYHGNEETFNLLMKEPLSDDVEHNRNMAYAIGSRSRDIELSIEQEIDLIDRAVSTKDAKLTRGYFYGYYRNFRTKKMSTEAQEHLLFLWDNYYPDAQDGNQAIVRILSSDYIDKVIRHFPIERYSHMDVQLAIEVAQAVGRVETTELTPVILNTLLDHRNSNVRIAALQALQQHTEVAKRLFTDIMNKIALIDHRDPYLRMVAFNTIQNPEEYRAEALAAAGDNPYMQTMKYEFLGKTDSEDQLFNVLKVDVSHENYLNRFYATMGLSEFWQDASDQFKTENTAELKSLVQTLAEEKDRSITVALASFYEDENLFAADGFSGVEQLLADYALPADVEVFQTYSDVLLNQYPEEAYDLIQSWAAEGNKALNTWMRRAGWVIPEGIDKSPEFRTPDWNELAKISIKPYVVIETAKGDIIIKLDVLTAPATISGMASLIKDREYNWVPFHRVVPNFVVQGGDVETRNGYGGPDYTVPTEASAAMYERGKVGIASAGTDTEGSQYFMMHQWAPHLNGRYTIIGEVVEGMDVVDRITQGDLVEKLRWY